jgi:hypothetical protein
MMETLIATTLLATSAQGALCTFENLPAPTIAGSDSSISGFMYDGLSSYEGFNFTSSYPQSNYQWAYYDLVGGQGWGGYDEGIIGDRALFTPWGSRSSYNYRISRNELWTLNTLDITAVWSNITLVIEGYRYGEGIFSYTAQLSTAQRVRLNIAAPYPGPLNQITEIKVYGTGDASQLAIDNINYTIVPAPSALALVGIA